MALVRNVTKKLIIPNEDDQYAIIRKLNHKILKTAAKARQAEGVSFMREIGGEILKALKDEDTDKVKKLQDAQEADVTNYDRDELLKQGVVDWSYDAKLPDGTDDLDESTAKFLATEILSFSRGETKEEAKNG